VDPAAELTRLVRSELDGEAPHYARAVSDAIRARHGGCVAAVLFYGSCLRRRTPEGVLDLYVLVDDYRSAYPSRALAWANALLPPNVFYVEVDDRGRTLRAKYALISRRAFAHAVSPRCRHSYIWARFAQPALLVHARDEDARAEAAALVARAAVTLVRRLGVFLPARADEQRFSSAELWQEAFRRTYASETRVESDETVRGIATTAPERYRAVLALALRTLEAEGWLDRVEVCDDAFSVRMPPGRRSRARWRWRLERPLAKSLAFARLLKTAFTFGDWLPYALWKLERHSGVRVVPTERQRRHPLIFGWPVLYQLVRDRALR
jgi:hypothetical protein